VVVVDGVFAAAAVSDVGAGESETLKEDGEVYGREAQMSVLTLLNSDYLVGSHPSREPTRKQKDTQQKQNVPDPDPSAPTFNSPSPPKPSARARASSPVSNS
jgi:hypothetical protein